MEVCITSSASRDDNLMPSVASKFLHTDGSMPVLTETVDSFVNSQFWGTLAFVERQKDSE
jgi:hypothetical protein